MEQKLEHDMETGLRRRGVDGMFACPWHGRSHEVMWSTPVGLQVVKLCQSSAYWPTNPKP